MTTGSKLSGSPKLKFEQDAGGDTITRNSGTWDGGDGFAIGQIITITGALNAGTYTITDISNGGRTLVLDARQSVDEVMTSALSIVGSVNAAEEVSQINGDDSPDAGGRRLDAPMAASPAIGDGSPDRIGRDAGVPTEVSPIDSDDGAEARGRISDVLAEAGPIIIDDGPDARRRETDAHGRAIRSATEITNILQALCDEELAVTAYLEKGELLFVSRLRAVDPDLGRIIIEYSQWKPANSALLDCKQVLFHCERKKRHIQFLTAAPAEIVFGESASIQVGFPKFVLDLQQRTHRRYRVKSLPSIWCVINREASDAIVANVSDISSGGLGAFIHDPGIVVKPGTIFKNCQITGSSFKRPINVSIEVRYWKTIRAQDGTLSKRVGCRFAASSSDLQELINMFAVDLDEDGSAH